MNNNINVPDSAYQRVLGGVKVVFQEYASKPLTPQTGQEFYDRIIELRGIDSQCDQWLKAVVDAYIITQAAADTCSGVKQLRLQVAADQLFAIFYKTLSGEEY